MASFNGKTKQISIGHTTAVLITAKTAAKIVVIKEDPTVNGWPTTPINIMMPTASDDPLQIPTGGSYTFEPNHGNVPWDRYAVGEPIGYAILPSGATTLIQYEA